MIFVSDVWAKATTERARSNIPASPPASIRAKMRDWASCNGSLQDLHVHTAADAGRADAKL